MLTTDARLLNRLTDPKWKHRKRYWAQVDGGPVSGDALAALRAGGLPPILPPPLLPLPRRGGGGGGRGRPAYAPAAAVRLMSEAPPHRREALAIWPPRHPPLRHPALLRPAAAAPPGGGGGGGSGGLAWLGIELTEGKKRQVGLAALGVVARRARRASRARAACGRAPSPR